MIANCCSRRDVFAVLAAPVERVALRQRNVLAHRFLRFVHGARQVAPLDAELHADVPRIIFAIDERRAVSLMDVGKLGDGHLLPGGRRHQQVADLLRARAIFGLHAHDQVKQPLALNDLRRGLSAYAGLDDALDVGHVDAVARDFFAVHIDLHAGLAQFAHHGQLREAREPAKECA